MKLAASLLGAAGAFALLMAFAMYAGWIPMMGLSAVVASDDVHDWQFVEPPSLTGIEDAGTPHTTSYARQLDEKGGHYVAFEAYRDELSWYLATNAHAQVLELAPKLAALVQKLEPPPLVSPQLPQDFEAARKSLDEARTPEDLATAASNFRFCAQIAPWLPELYLQLSIAENAADELRAAERHLQVYLRLKPEASSRSDIQRFQTSLQKSIAATHAWENSLGMRFVPVSGTTVRFCIWETRVKDYSLFVEETGRPWSRGGITSSEPATILNLYDAAAFCDWLTEKERREGLIGEHDRYRLPTHDEWTIAVGAGPEEEPDVPVANRYRTFPWGEDWPPPPGAGNLKGGESARKYEELRAAGLISKSTMDENMDSIEGYEDGFTELAPVGSFDANLNGLYDMAGNVQEWCADSQAETAMPMTTLNGNSSITAYTRGGSFNSSLRPQLGSLEKHPFPALESLYDDTGFRCVLAKEDATLALYEVVEAPVEGGRTISGDFEPNTRFIGPHPLIQVRNLRNLWVSTSSRNPGISVEFESTETSPASSTGQDGQKRFFMSIGTNPQNEGARGTDFLVPAHGITLEEQRLTFAFSNKEEFENVRRLVEPWIAPRHLFEVPRPKQQGDAK